MAAKRLLVVTDEMEVGGSQRQITYLLRGLDREQWQPELLYFRNDSFLVQQMRDIGITVHHLPKQGRIDPRFVLRYAALLRRGRYDLIHAFSITAELWTVIARLLARGTGPVVSSVRGLYFTEPKWFWRIKRFVIGRSAAVIANAEACAVEAAKRSGMPLARFDVVPNGIAIPEPLAEAEKARRREALMVPPGRSFGLFVGRLVLQKNVPCLIRALASMPAHSRPWVALAGGGPLQAEMEAMAAAAGLQHDLVFLGERSDVSALMQTADFLVLPSVQEGMSNVVLEAMAAGCPVIASRVGGNPELIVEGVSGLLFPSDDALALAACLQRLESDPSLRAQLSTQARRRAQDRHSMKALVNNTVAVYERCLGGNAASLRLPQNASITEQNS